MRYPSLSTTPRGLLIWLLILILSSMGACSDPTPIKIGFVGTLSGRRSEIGVAARNAAQLRIDQINAAGGVKGHPLKLVIKDNLGSTEICEEVLTQMINDGIQFIIGPLFSQMAEVTLKTIEGKDVLIVSPTMSTDFLTGKDDNLIRTSSTTTKQAHTLAEHAHSLGLKKVSVVYDLSNRKYTELLYTAFKKKAKEYGTTIPMVLTIDRDEHPQMMPLAKQLMNTGSDGVLLCLSAVDAANLGQQIRKVGYQVQLLGGSWAQTDDLILHGGKAVEGMRLISTREYGKPSPAIVAFNEKYFSQYNTLPSFASGRAYDAVGILTKGMMEADKIEHAAVKKTILKIGTYPGLSNSLKLDSYGDSLSGYSMVEVKDGTYVPAD